MTKIKCRSVDLKQTNKRTTAEFEPLHTGSLQHTTHKYPKAKAGLATKPLPLNQLLFKTRVFQLPFREGCCTENQS